MTSANAFLFDHKIEIVTTLRATEFLAAHSSGWWTASRLDCDKEQQEPEELPGKGLHGEGYM
ncbi:hypothetical protein TWF225_010004 [Orbilia oligospora]|nr:hypothetical protein TWF225_010004 [Orbilia oligospora]KAF3271182.1 hypothetical protein TWF217_005593 [Orbilia oligospora]KAF3271730.1 hypothetical protein TWF128_000279 [Orbilia oligospora]